MDNNTIIDILFKIKNKKVSSTLTKLFFEEDRVESEMLNPNRIASKASSIPIPAPSPANGVVGIMNYHSDLLLTEDVSVSNKVSWNTGLLKNFIDPSYHASYEVQLFDDDGSGNIGNQIFASDPSDWYFFYNSGQLTFFGDNSSHNATSNHGYHIKIYGYVGGFGAGAGDLNSSVEVNQVGHGLIVGDLIYRDPITPDYQKAIADGIAPEKSDIVGVVKSVIDIDTFVYQYLIGEFINTGSGFPSGIEGDAIFASNITPGLMTNIPPSTLGHISKPVGIILEASAKMLLFQMRGMVINASGGGSTPAGGVEYDYYVTENDFDDLKSALSDNSYLSVFIPNGTYSAPVNPGINALEITNAKLVNGETRDGVIIDLNSVASASPTSTGLKISDSNAVLKNISIIDFTVSNNYPLYGLSGGGASVSNIKVERVRNLTTGSNGYGVYAVSNSTNISSNDNDVDIKGVSYSSVLYGKTMENLSHINGIKTPIKSSLVDSTDLNNVSLNAATMSNCININNLHFSMGDDGGFGIDNCSNLSNIELSVYGPAVLGVIRDSKNISNLIALGASEADYILYNCENLSNIYIEGDGTSYSIQKGIDNCRYLDNIKIKNCLSNPIINSEYINNLHLENNLLGLTSNVNTDGHVSHCKNIVNSVIYSVTMSSLIYPTYTANMYCNCRNLTNCIGYGNGKYSDGLSSQYGFYKCSNLSNCLSLGAELSSFYDCNDLSICSSINPYISLASSDDTKACFENCNNLDNIFILRNKTDYHISGFYNCENVNNVKGDLGFTVGNLYQINHVFNNCKILSNINLSNIVSGFNDCNIISNVFINQSTGRAFYNSSLILNTSIMNGGLELDDATEGMLEDCENITNCNILSDSAHNASYFSFLNCEKLINCKSIGFDNSNTDIATGFKDCNHLVNCEAKYSVAASYDNCDFISDSTSENGNKNLSSTSLVKGEFENCKNIKGSNVLRVGVAVVAFLNCEKISNCNIGLEDYSKNSFSYGFSSCDIINDVTIHHINNEYFINCNNLTNIKIVSIRGISFNNCNNLTNITIESTNSHSSQIQVFVGCTNISNILFTTTLSNITLFEDSKNINGCIVKHIYGGAVSDFVIAKNCKSISNIEFNDGITYNFSYTGISGLFNNTDFISNIDIVLPINLIESVLDYLYIFRDCSWINNVNFNIYHSDLFSERYKYINLFLYSSHITNCNVRMSNVGVRGYNDGSGSTDGFYNFFRKSFYISNVKITASNIGLITDSHALNDKGANMFSQCEHISNSRVFISDNEDPTGGDIKGFESCNFITGVAVLIAAPGVGIIASDNIETNVAANNF